MKKPILYKIAFFAIFGLLALSSVAQEPIYHNRKRPKLVVQIVVSHMRYDYMSRLAKNFGTDGFSRMLSHGLYYTNARYNYMFTHSSPGIATLMTGTQPSLHGIIGDRWINFTTNEVISAISDTAERGVGCNEDEGQFSPRSLPVSTVSDELKRMSPQSKVVSIASFPEGAILAGGYNPDDVYWFDSRYGKWVTSSYYKPLLPKWVTKFNDSPLKEEYSSKLWNISIPFTDYVNKKASSIILDTNVKFTFEMMFKPKSREFRRINETPFGNNYLKDFAIEAIKNDSLGADSAPDLLILNFGAQKYISEYYGVESTELEDAFYKLDETIAELITYLENTIGRDNIAIVLTSDHGTSDNVRSATTATRGARVGTFNAIQFKVLINSFLSARLGEGTWVSEYRNRQVYLNRRLLFERKYSLSDIQNQVATFATQFDGVAHAITASALQNNYFGEGMARKVQNSYFPKHSGDVIINLLPGWIELENESAEWVISSSGSPYEYDVHVPLVWYGGAISGGAVHRAVDMVDIAPTVSEVLGITPPNASEGKVLQEIINNL